MKFAVLAARFLMAKIIQLIDNTPQQSHNPSQQARNPPQQIYASLQFSATVSSDNSSHFSGLVCSLSATASNKSSQFRR
jgi:hypothetical protein